DGRRGAIQGRGQSNGVGPIQPLAQAIRKRWPWLEDIGLVQAGKQANERRPAGTCAPWEFLHHTAQDKNLGVYTGVPAQIDRAGNRIRVIRRRTSFVPSNTHQRKTLL